MTEDILARIKELKKNVPYRDGRLFKEKRLEGMKEMLDAIEDIVKNNNMSVDEFLIELGKLREALE